MKTIIHKSCKYRIYPNKEQQNLLVNQFGQVRFVYNYFLKQRIDYYIAHKGEEKQSLNYYDTAKMLTELKKQEEYVWLNDSSAQSLQQVLRNLDVSYNHFFRDGFQFPKFKKKSNKQSFTVPQHFSILNNKLTIPKIKNIKVKFHCPLTGVIKKVTISQEPSGKYYASFLCEVEVNIVPKTNGKEVGIDLGLKSFLVTSDGLVVDNPKHLHKSERKLKKLQYYLSRKEKGSKNRNKARIKVAKVHEKISNQRNDFLHKLSKKLVDENQIICAEDLNIKGMVKNHCLAKSISDVGWSEFIRQIKYKSEWYGTKFEQIDRFFPSSKRCNACGWINDSLKLSDREWVCHNCGLVVDRDLNAALNILQFGKLNMVGQGMSEPKRLGKSRVVKRIAEPENSI